MFIYFDVGKHRTWNLLSVVLAKFWVLDLKNVAALCNHKNFLISSREIDFKLPLVPLSMQKLFSLLVVIIQLSSESWIDRQGF